MTSLTIPLLKQLTKTARSPRAIIVIEPDEDNPLLEEARLTGARVVIGDPASPDLLRPIISSWRGCALSQLYALSGKVAENEAVIDEAARILSRYQPDPDRQPHLVALIDDPRHADHWRGARSGRSGVWFEDALSSAESHRARPRLPGAAHAAAAPARVRRQHPDAGHPARTGPPGLGAGRAREGRGGRPRGGTGPAAAAGRAVSAAA